MNKKDVSMKDINKEKNRQVKRAVFYDCKNVPTDRISNALCDLHKYISDAAQILNVPNVKLYFDYGINPECDKRPDLQRMLKHLTEKKVDYVIVMISQVLSQNESERLDLVKEIEKSGAKLIPLFDKFYQQLEDSATNEVEGYIENDDKQDNSTCKACRKKMTPANGGCKVSRISCNGKIYKRIKAGDAMDLVPDMDESDICHDCGVKRGQYHHWGCDVERCPDCFEQLIMCECDVYALVKNQNMTKKL